MTKNLFAQAIVDKIISKRKFKIGQDKKSLISTFSCFFTDTVKI